MKTPKVTVGVLLYKSEKYLAHSLPSLLEQDYGNVEFVFRDHSPNGEIYDYLMYAHPEFFKKAKIKRGENLMHSGGHNALIREALWNGSEYYICASNDMLYPRNMVSHIIRGMEGAEPRKYVATCKLMQWEYEKVLTGNLRGSQTGIIDSYGIGMTKSHHFYDIGQGQDEHDVKLPDKMLGPSAALAVYHKDALEAIAYKNEKGETEYFDENLYHKNDVDLAYRLSWAGFPCYLAKDVKVYHDRQTSSHTKKSDWVKQDSLKGHLITLDKNFDEDFSWHVKLRTYLNLGLRLFYTVTMNMSSFQAYNEVRKLKDEIEKKKQAIRKNVSPADIEVLMS